MGQGWSSVGGIRSPVLRRLPAGSVAGARLDLGREMGDLVTRYCGRSGVGRGSVSDMVDKEQGTVEDLLRSRDEWCHTRSVVEAIDR